MSATEIIPRLSVGNWQSAQSAPAGTCIVTVAIDSPFIGRYHFKLVDGPGNDMQDWREAIKCVKECYNSGHNVLVHCVSGRSRSAGIAAAALAQLRRISIHEAYDLVKNRRAEVQIHPAISQLMLTVG